MFEKGRLRMKMNRLLQLILYINQRNKERIERKLPLCKQLLRNPNEQLIDESLVIIKQQLDDFAKINSYLFKLGYINQIRLSGHTKEFVELMYAAQPLLKRLLEILKSELALLRTKSVNIDILKAYRGEFLKELGIYKKFRNMSNEVGSEVLNSIKEEIKAIVPKWTKSGKEISQEIPQVASRILIAFAVLGFMDPKLVESSFNEIEYAYLTWNIITIPDSIIQINYYIRQLKKII